MIFPETYVYILDNSGARTAKCIKILNNKFPGKITDYIIVAVQRYNPQKKLRAGDLHLGVIVNTAFKFSRNTGQWFKGSRNGIILLKKDWTPLGNRVYLSYLFQEMRQKGLTKLISLCRDIR